MSSSPIEQDPSSTQTFGVADVVNSVDSPVVGLSQQDAAAIAALPSGTALLLVHHGPTTGARFLLDAEEDVGTRSSPPCLTAATEFATPARSTAPTSTARVWSRWLFAPVMRSRSVSTG